MINLPYIISLLQQGLIQEAEIVDKVDNLDKPIDSDDIKESI